MRFRSLTFAMFLLLFFPLRAHSGLTLESEDANFSLRGSVLTPYELSDEIDGNYTGQSGFSITTGFDFWGWWPPNKYEGHPTSFGFFGYRFSSLGFEYSGPADLGILDPATRYQGHELFADIELPLFSGDRTSLNFVHGMHTGIGKFTMSDELYGFLGGTGTELGREMGEFQHMHGGSRGLRLNIGKHVSASTDADFSLSPQYNKFWHTEISSILWNLTMIVPSAFISEERNSFGWVACFAAIDTALLLWYYDVQARQYNWPYDDGEALRWKTISLGASISF